MSIKYAGTNALQELVTKTKAYVAANVPTATNEIAKFFVDNPSFKYNGNPMYLQDIAGKNLTDADVQAYLTALGTKYGSFSHNQDSRIPYTATRWAVLQSANFQTYTLWYVLPDQDAIYHLVPNQSYQFVEGLDGLMDNVSTYKNDANYLTPTTGVTSVNGGVGAITNIATLNDLPTSINGLSGGQLTSPLIIKGGDAATASKIALDQSASGQITNNATQTIFGFTSNNATTLTVGHSSYALGLRGSGTRPKYNSNDVAMSSDLGTQATFSLSGTTLTITPK